MSKVEQNLIPDVYLSVFEIITENDIKIQSKN